MGGWQIGCFTILLLSVYMFTSVVRASPWGTEQYLFVVLLVLVSGSIMAAVLGLYPFGGIRQHLFAAPLIILCTAQAVVSLGARYHKYGIAALVLLFAVVAVIDSIARLPQAYSEREDVVSAVMEGLKNVPDSKVYVYYGAKPAVAFHYPHRAFYKGRQGRGQIKLIGEEILRLTASCQVSILFSHVHKSEDDEILAFLASSGLQILNLKKYHRASVATLSRCLD